MVLTRIPLIKTIMTPFPYSVNIDTTVADARKYMDDHQIHHLPVMETDRIVGILERRDFDIRGPEKISDMNLRTPRIFDLNERLDNILEIMAENRLDTVLVTRNNKLVGIFTDTDACRQFASYLREEFGPHDGNDAA